MPLILAWHKGKVLDFKLVNKTRRISLAKVRRYCISPFRKNILLKLSCESLALKEKKDS